MVELVKGGTYVLKGQVPMAAEGDFDIAKANNALTAA